MLVSGGWDNNVFIYDMRYRGPIHAIFGPHICGDSIDFKSDGYTMVCGSHRGEDALEVYDLRMMRRSRVIAWDGTGSQELFAQEPETETDIDALAPETDLEQEERKDSDSDDDATTAETRPQRSKDNPTIAPFIYTTMINQREDLIFAGGAGKNEMRVFDFEAGSIVAMIGNSPKSILTRATGRTTEKLRPRWGSSRASCARTRGILRSA